MQASLPGPGSKSHASRKIPSKEDLIESSKVTGVVAAPYKLDRGTSLAVAFDALARCGLKRILVPYEEQSLEPSRRGILDAIELGAGERSAAAPSIEPLPVRTSDSAFRWRAGAREAFQDPACEAVFLFPGDFIGRVEQSHREGWPRMVEEANAHRLVLGDYQSNDPFKETFDVRFALPMVGALYEDLLARASALGLSKLRTEYSVIGREYFERFEESTLHDWGADPTLQWILFGVAEQREIRIVHLGTSDDPAEDRDAIGQVRQVVRLASQLMLDRLRTVCWTRPHRDPGAEGALLRELFGELIERATEGAGPRAPVTNSKVTSLDPLRWAPYRGFSLLHRQPGDAPAVLHTESARHPELALYRALAAAREELPLEGLGFCRLPAETFHDTVFDGLHAGNTAQLDEPLRALVNGLPDTAAALARETSFFDASPLAGELPRPIRYRFDQLSVWGNRVLVAQLAPTEESREAFRWICDQRQQLNAEVEARLGFRPSRPSFTPHVSLGYLAAETDGRAATEALPAWDALFRAAVGAATLEFRSIARFFFDDMSTFRRW